ncbi:MAG: cell division protein ZapB [Thermodesulfobacteriota bacterium]|nr:cell division protein ZapB [Thermodesulfobacteriota bacterium]
MEEDTIPAQFKKLEDRIGQLVGKCQDLQRAKAASEATIREFQEAIKTKDAAQQEHAEEKTMIRSRIDALLSRLDQVVGSG